MTTCSYEFSSRVVRCGVLDPGGNFHETRINTCDNDEPSRYVGKAAPRRPNCMALGLIRHAVRVVPVGYRCRYDEEFRADLTELARDRGRWVQVGYAFRVLMHGLALRRLLCGVTPERVES
jgi:hypothetical protein